MSGALCVVFSFSYYYIHPGGRRGHWLFRLVVRISLVAPLQLSRAIGEAIITISSLVKRSTPAKMDGLDVKVYMYVS